MENRQRDYYVGIRTFADPTANRAIRDRGPRRKHPEPVVIFEREIQNENPLRQIELELQNLRRERKEKQIPREHFTVRHRELTDKLKEFRP